MEQNIPICDIWMAWEKLANSVYRGAHISDVAVLVSLTELLVDEILFGFMGNASQVSSPMCPVKVIHSEVYFLAILS